MATLEITTENFETTVNRPGIVLLDFWAAWCGPCRAFAPRFEEASTRHTDLIFGKIDTEAQPEISAAFGISAIPTLVAFRDGVPVFAQPGALPGAALDRLIDELRKLDMDEVRRKVAQAQAKAQS